MEHSNFMFAEPLLEAGKWIKGLIPTNFKPGRPHFNFLTVHYLYLISLTILCSIMLYPAGLMKYIDALFFAAGSATQSGLNTINLNDLYLYQQVVMILVSCIANPIFINTVVVFIRLYWFEKRFQGIVQEAQKTRRIRTISRSRSQARGDQPTDLEQGVAGRQIRVLHETTRPNGMTEGTNAMQEKQQTLLAAAHGRESTSESSAAASTSESSTRGNGSDEIGQHPTLNRDITFADEVPRSRSPGSDTGERIPDTRGTEHHIAFLERQRKQDQGTLRIPGPRDFERGDVPQQIDDSDEDLAVEDAEGLPATNRRRRSTMSNEEKIEGEDAQRKGIAFDVPNRPGNDPNRPGKSKPNQNDSGHQHTPRFNPLRPFSNFRRTVTSGSTSLASSLHKIRNSTPTMSLSRSQARDMGEIMPYLSWQPTIGRNSAFVDLTEAQREELGGIEYRSLKTLALILVGYYVGFQLLGSIVLIPWIRLSATYGAVVDNVAQNRVWWAIFTPASMFTDLGFTLTPDSMIHFQTAILPLVLGSFLIIIGNTGFPCMLRFIIWVLSKVASRGSGLWEELNFLLDHPRRCFTLLFPSRATWWLFWLLVLLNGLDLVFFIILDLNDPVVTALSPGIRVLNGWFQAVSTRTAGFACVNLAGLHPAIQVSYMVMMYISVFPIAISVRRTNVYEEKSLGIWGGEDEDDGEGNKSYVGTHLRRQLSFDLWYIFLGVFVITICEGSRIQNDPTGGFTIFAILFEVVSAYGTVGLSLGYPGIDASFSAEFSVISKLVIIAMMLRGRHRGLPYALDRAILLPSENLHRKETEEATMRAGRRMSMAGTIENTATNQGLGGPPVNFRRTHSRRMSENSGISGRTALTSRAPKKHGLGRVLSNVMGAGPMHSRAFKDD